MSAASKRRVVVTGVGALSPLGHDWSAVRERLRTGRTAIRVMEEWAAYEGLSTRLGSTVPSFDLPAHYNRKTCLLYTSPSPRDLSTSRMPSSA